MKHFVKYFVVTFFLIFCTAALAEQKIVFLDLKYVLNNSKAGKGAQDYLKKTASFCIDLAKKLGATDATVAVMHSISETVNFDFEGYAIGGLAVGEGHEKMIEVVDYTAPQLPEDKVRYLMGVGKPNDIIEAVYRGVDIFDCVFPTREGRHGIAYVGSSSINIKNSKFESDLTPLDESSDYFVSKKYSKSYLNHLLKIKDPLGPMLISLHNLNYYFNLMIDLGVSIEEGRLDSFREDFYKDN